MFVNPLFYLNPLGQRVIEQLAPSTLVVYHLAAAKEGVVSPFERAVLNESQKKGELPYQLILLDQLGQTETF